MRRTLLPFFVAACIGLLPGCTDSGLSTSPSDAPEDSAPEAPSPNPNTGVELLVLGVAQDAGYPQIRCQKECCRKGWSGELSHHVVSLALLDHESGQRWLFEASPDIREQMQSLDEMCPAKADSAMLQGIFLSHAHIGHYTGLMQLGHEAMGAQGLPVYAMPRMKAYLEQNGPWSQLVSKENIHLRPLAQDTAVRLNQQVKVVPIRVPHRDEYSETVGYRIEGPRKSALFIPDIDKWERWDRDIREEIKKVDIAFLDATFYANGELPGRDMSVIQHPFVVESMALMEHLSPADRAKVYFIHFNHTNPLLDPENEAVKKVEEAGFHVSAEGMRFAL